METMTIGEYLVVSKKKPRKYRNTPSTVDGIRFASKKEALRYVVLRDKMRGGDIYGLQLQPRYDLVVNGKHICTYVADFRYTRRGVSKTTVEDVKGVQTRDFKIKWALAQALYPHFDWRLS